MLLGGSLSEDERSDGGEGTAEGERLGEVERAGAA